MLCSANYWVRQRPFAFLFLFASVASVSGWQHNHVSCSLSSCISRGRTVLWGSHYGWGSYHLLKPTQSQSSLGGRSSTFSWPLLLSYEGKQTIHESLTENGPENDEDPLAVAMKELGFSSEQNEMIRQQLVLSGLWEDEMTDGRIARNDLSSSASHMLLVLARDFVDRPEQLSSMLQSDFGLKPLVAHQVRAAVLHALQKETQQYKQKEKNGVPDIDENNETGGERTSSPLENSYNDTLPSLSITSRIIDADKQKPLYKATIVNDNAKRRKQRTLSSSASRGEQDNENFNSNSYGLPRDYAEQFPQLAAELDTFYTFMTRPSTASQEASIKPATAKVYMRHAKLFLGWYLSNGKHSNNNSLSLYTIIETKEKESVSCFLDFILWLRSERHISVSYEANLVRGLTKLLKFRFARESKTDPSYGDEKPFHDIPAIREARKWHRDAEKKRKVSPRSSDEERKWLSWPEYLGVVRSAKEELEGLLEDYSKHEDPRTKAEEAYVLAQQRKVAITFQKYLILAIFANVPDRQRTIRELELNRSFIKDKQSGCWVIKHSPEDYKTGSTYGDRPPLQLSASLTPSIEDFIERWRPFLKPVSNMLFVQSRTGNPLTQDSVYQAVARTCFRFTGKRTNPHLLRDMIVTHIRESANASEKELEALALFMGHSLNMQRTSYDRRTLKKKVAPAVELLRSVNSNNNEQDATNGRS